MGDIGDVGSPARILEGIALPLALGAASLVLMLAGDWADSRGRRRLWALGRGCSHGLFALAFLALAIQAPRFTPPTALRLLAVISTLFSAYLLLRSLFLDLAHDGSRSGKPEDPPKLVTTGVYGLSRHPGLPSLFLFQASFGLALGSLPLLLALLPWTALNLLLCLVEDRYFFPRVFGAAYQSYAREVPFALPRAAVLLGRLRDSHHRIRDLRRCRRAPPLPPTTSMDPKEP